MTAYLDESESVQVAVLCCEDSPSPGWSSWSTVTLHESENLLDGKDVRVELQACAASSDLAMANVLATAAFDVSKDRLLAAPGVVFADAVRRYFPTTTTPHIMWAEPFNHPELSSIEMPGDVDVHCLLAVPLSDREFAHLTAEGYDALERELEQNGAEFFDLWRPSVL